MRTISLLVFALLLAVTPAGAQTDAQTIPLEGTPNDVSGTIYYAADMGFYEKAGLRVSITTLNNPGTAAAALAKGSFAIGGLPLTVAAIAREKGLPLVMIAPAGIYSSAAPTSGLIVLKDAPYRKAADLNGKTIATRDLSNVSYFAAKLWIDKNGGDSKTIRWVEINDPLDVAALHAGRIDAASISEPALDAALRGGEVRTLAPIFDTIAKRFLIGAYFTSEDYARSHPEIVRKFADVMAVSGDWANKNRAQSGQILAKYAQAPVLADSTRVIYPDGMRASDVQPVLDLMFRNGLLKSPMRAKDLFSNAIPSR